MIFNIGNFALEKATKYKETAETVPIRVVANRLKIDKEDHEMLPQAFNKATVDFYLSEGIFDWHHQSVLGQTSEERARAILGKPQDFAFEDGVPVVYGVLTKANSIVRESILPHLNAGIPVLGASVGGWIRKANKVFDATLNKAKTVISNIHWNHTAIAALPYVMSSGSNVSLVKAMMGSNPVPVLNFDSVSAFESSFGQFQQLDFELLNANLTKALEAGSALDISQITGGQVLQPQSLGGVSQLIDIKDDEELEKLHEFLKAENRSIPLVKSYIKAVENKLIPDTDEAATMFFRANGLSELQAMMMTNALIEALSETDLVA